LAAPETFYDAGIVHYLPALPAVCCTNASGQNRLIFGLPFHNRKDHERRKMPGVFTSVSPLCIEVHPECTFEELMQGIHKRQKKAFRHQRYPLGFGRNWVRELRDFRNYIVIVKKMRVPFRYSPAIKNKVKC